MASIIGQGHGIRIGLNSYASKNLDLRYAHSTTITGTGWINIFIEGSQLLNLGSYNSSTTAKQLIFYGQFQRIELNDTGTYPTDVWLLTVGSFLLKQIQWWIFWQMEQSIN